MVLSRDFRGPLIQGAVIVLFVSIHPYRWVNGYQDLWLGLFAVFAMRSLAARKFNEAVWFILLLVGLKNEGMLHAVLLGGYLVWLEWRSLSTFLSRARLKDSALFLMAGLAILSWKTGVLMLHLKNPDLSLSFPGWSVFAARWMDFGRTFLSLCFNNPNLLPLPAALCFGLIFPRMKLSWISAGMVILVLIPLSLTPQDFATHLGTAFSRVIVPGLMCLVYLGAREMDSARHKIR